jgi:hypothetical protein
MTRYKAGISPRSFETTLLFDGLSDDDVAEELGRVTVESVTCGADSVLSAFDDNAPEEIVSPFPIPDVDDEDEDESQE